LRNVFKLLVAQGFSVFAFRAFQIVFAWACLSQTGSGGFLAGIVGLSWLVNLVAIPLAGHFVDRRGGKRALTASIFVSLLCTFLFFCDSKYFGLHVGLGAAALILTAVADCVISIAPNSMIPRLVTGEHVTRCVGYAASINAFQSVVGAVVGGAMLGFLGTNAALGILVGMLSAALISATSMRWSPAPIDAVTSAESPYAAMLKGFAALATIVPERSLCMMAIVSNFVLTPLVSIVIPVFVRFILHAPVAYLATAELGIGIGMIGGTLAAPLLINRGVSRLALVLGGNLMAAACVCLVAFLSSPVAQVAMVGGIGLGVALNNVACGSLRGHATPDKIRGRLEAAVFACCVASIPLGSWIFGLFATAATVGYLRWAILCAGLVMLLSSAVLVFSKQTRSALTTSDNELNGFYAKNYPNAFR
jgi:MFS transporter, DHA3 family, macrolide efflux protein